MSFRGLTLGWSTQEDLNIGLSQKYQRYRSRSGEEASSLTVDQIPFAKQKQCFGKSCPESRRAWKDVFIQAAFPRLSPLLRSSFASCFGYSLVQNCNTG